QGSSHRAEIIRRDGEMRSFQFLSSWTGRLSDNGKCRSAIVAGKWHGKGAAGCFYSGQETKFGQNLFEKLAMFFRLGIFRFRQNELSHKCMRRVKARLGRAQIREALN